MVGKPQDEVYYEEYKKTLKKVIDNEKLPVIYNVNFGHAAPRCALQYGIVTKVDMKQKKIYMGNTTTDVAASVNPSSQVASSSWEIGRDEMASSEIPLSFIRSNKAFPHIP